MHPTASRIASSNGAEKRQIALHHPHTSPPLYSVEYQLHLLSVSSVLSPSTNPSFPSAACRGKTLVPCFQAATRQLHWIDVHARPSLLLDDCAKVATALPAPPSLPSLRPWLGPPLFPQMARLPFLRGLASVAAAALVWAGVAGAADKSAGEYFVHSLPGAPDGSLIKMHAG